jgi:hypothetical protein
MHFPPVTASSTAAAAAKRTTLTKTPAALAYQLPATAFAQPAATEIRRTKAAQLVPAHASRQCTLYPPSCRIPYRGWPAKQYAQARRMSPGRATATGAEAISGDPDGDDGGAAIGDPEGVPNGDSDGPGRGGPDGGWTAPGKATATRRATWEAGWLL